MNKSEVKNEEHNSFYENEELTFKELIIILWKSKVSIILITTIFAVSSVIYSLSLTNIYTSTAVLKVASNENQSSISNLAGQYSGLANLAGISLPSGGSADKSTYVLATLKSNDFLKHIVEFDKVKENILAAKLYDPESQSIIYNEEVYIAEDDNWVRVAPPGRKQIPSYIEISESLKGNYRVNVDQVTKLITISYTHLSPIFAYEFISLVERELNNLTKFKDINESEKALEYLYAQLELIQQKDIRNSINQLIESQLKTNMMANIKSDYVVTVIDSPYIAEKRTSPRRSVICILGTFIGGIFSIFFVLVRRFYNF